MVNARKPVESLVQADGRLFENFCQMVAVPSKNPVRNLPQAVFQLLDLNKINNLRLAGGGMSLVRIVRRTEFPANREKYRETGEISSNFYRPASIRQRF
jgi:hypothetical protein